MTDAERDPVLRRAIEELRRLPEADPDRVNRVVQAASATRVAPADDDGFAMPPRRANPRRVWIVAGVAAAAAIAGFLVRGLPVSSAGPRAATGVAAPATAGPVRVASNVPSDAVALPQSFSLLNAGAHRVSVVGDFNGWNAAAAPLSRSPDGALWSTIVPVLPGRHLYGFMIDDSLFVLDPRAPKANDPDLGSEGSVVIVGRP